MLREARKLGTRSQVCSIFIGTLLRKHHLHRILPYRFFPVMGVTVSSQRRQKKVVKRVPEPSFASFSTTGTLTTSAYVDEGETETKTVLERLNMLIQNRLDSLLCLR